LRIFEKKQLEGENSPQVLILRPSLLLGKGNNALIELLRSDCFIIGAKAILYSLVVVYLVRRNVQML